VFWFANFALTMSPCDPRYRPVPRCWFAIWFAKPIRHEAMRQLENKNGASA
jgi:hypothetical protein